jgi:hypothetical protein
LVCVRVAVHSMVVTTPVDDDVIPVIDGDL